MALDKRPQRRATTGSLRPLQTTTEPQSTLQTPRRPRGVAGAGTTSGGGNGEAGGGGVRTSRPVFSPLFSCGTAAVLPCCKASVV